MAFDDEKTLVDRYRRLQQDLARAYRELPWQSSLIDRIADELQATEQALALQHMASARRPPSTPTQPTGRSIRQ